MRLTSAIILGLFVSACTSPENPQDEQTTTWTQTESRPPHCFYDPESYVPAILTQPDSGLTTSQFTMEFSVPVFKDFPERATVETELVGEDSTESVEFKYNYEANLGVVDIAILEPGDYEFSITVDPNGPQICGPKTRLSAAFTVSHPPCFDSPTDAPEIVDAPTSWATHDTFTLAFNAIEGATGYEAEYALDPFESWSPMTIGELLPNADPDYEATAELTEAGDYQMRVRALFDDCPTHWATVPTFTLQAQRKLVSVELLEHPQNTDGAVWDLGPIQNITLNSFPLRRCDNNQPWDPGSFGVPFSPEVSVEVRGAPTTQSTSIRSGSGNHSWGLMFFSRYGTTPRFTIYEHSGARKVATQWNLPISSVTSSTVDFHALPDSGGICSGGNRLDMQIDFRPDAPDWELTIESSGSEPPEYALNEIEPTQNTAIGHIWTFDDLVWPMNYVATLRERDSVNLEGYTQVTTIPGWSFNPYGPEDLTLTVGVGSNQYLEITFEVVD